MVIHYPVLFILLNQFQHFIYQILHYLLEQGKHQLNLVFNLYVLFFFRDFKVVKINLNDDSNKMKYFDGHQAPILALNVYEDKRWLVTKDLFLYIKENEIGSF